MINSTRIAKNTIALYFRLFASFSFKRVVRQMKLAKFLVGYKRGLYDVREE